MRCVPVALSATLFLMTTVIGNMAAAEPPNHAPAHGYKDKVKYDNGRYKKHKKHQPEKLDDHRHDVNSYGQTGQVWGGYDPRYSNLYGANSYGIGQGRCHLEQLAANQPAASLGNAFGNAIGNAVGGNPLVGAIAGAMINQMLGIQTGQAMDQGDRFCFSQALTYGYDQRPVDWLNQASGRQYRIVPLRSYQNPTGNWCREFSYQLSQNGRPINNGSNTACRLADGTWQ